MPHTLKELTLMPEEQIRALGAELNIKKSKDLELIDLSYAILDEEAKIASKIPDPEPLKKKRGRPRKSDVVSTATTPAAVKENKQENKPDNKPAVKPVKKRDNNTKPAVAEAPEKGAAEVKPQPKKRGRKPKAEKLEAQAEAVTPALTQTETAASKPEVKAEPKQVEKAPQAASQSGPQQPKDDVPYADRRKIVLPPLPPKVKKFKNGNNPNNNNNQENKPQQVAENNQVMPQQQPAPQQNQPRFVPKPKIEFEGTVRATGVLEIMPDGYGFLRSSDYNYLNSPDDIYVSQGQIKNNALKNGDTVTGEIRPPRDGDKYFPLVKIDYINGRSPEFIRDRVPFEIGRASCRERV